MILSFPFWNGKFSAILNFQVVPPPGKEETYPEKRNIILIDSKVPGFGRGYVNVIVPWSHRDGPYGRK